MTHNLFGHIPDDQPSNSRASMRRKDNQVYPFGFGHIEDSLSA